MSSVSGTRSHTLILMRVMISSQTDSKKSSAWVLFITLYQLGVSISFSLTANANGWSSSKQLVIMSSTDSMLLKNYLAWKIEEGELKADKEATQSRVWIYSKWWSKPLCLYLRKLFDWSLVKKLDDWSGYLLRQLLNRLGYLSLPIRSESLSDSWIRGNEDVDWNGGSGVRSSVLDWISILDSDFTSLSVRSLSSLSFVVSSIALWLEISLWSEEWGSLWSMNCGFLWRVEAGSLWRIDCGSFGSWRDPISSGVSHSGLKSETLMRSTGSTYFSVR